MYGTGRNTTRKPIVMMLGYGASTERLVALGYKPRMIKKMRTLINLGE